MNLNTLKKRVNGTAMMAVMAFGMMVMASASAQAQYRDYDRRDDDRYDHRYDRGNWSSSKTKEYSFAYAYYVAYPQGREYGYRDSRASCDNLSDYRNDSNGYLSWMGNRNDYRSYYRRGFELGFRDGRDRRDQRFERRDVERILGARLNEVYGRDRRDRDRDNDYGRGRYNRDQIIRIAQQNGYNDGRRHGEEDRRRRVGYDYNDREYRDALRGYRWEYGDREFYRRAYREGYRRGYDEGYRRGGGWRWPF